MANIKQSKKRILVNEKKRAENTMKKSKLKTEIKKVKTLATANEKEKATAQLSETFACLDNAVKAGIIHKNKAANNKAKLSKTVNNIK